MRNYDTKRFFKFSETTRNTFFVFSYFSQFCETIETRRNSDLFRTVSHFAKQKKYETVNPSREESDFQISMRTGSDTYKQVLKHEGEKAGLTIATFDLL